MIALAMLFILVALVITNRIAGKTFVGKTLLAFDYFVSVLWSRDFGVTISSQCGLYWKRGNPPAFWYVLHKVLNTLQKGHCEGAIVGDLERARTVIKLLS